MHLPHRHLSAVEGLFSGNGSASPSAAQAWKDKELINLLWHLRLPPRYRTHMHTCAHTCAHTHVLGLRTSPPQSMNGQPATSLALRAGTSERRTQHLAVPNVPDTMRTNALGAIRFSLAGDFG